MERVALRDIVRTIFEQALADCSIERAFAQKIRIDSDSGAPNKVFFGDIAVDFTSVKYLRIVAAGKAAKGMLDVLLKRLPVQLSCDIAGVLIAPDAMFLPRGFRYFQGGHPFPNQASFDGAKAVLSLLENIPPDATRLNAVCIFLISGGASAMMELPLDPGISLEDAIAFYRVLVHSGAAISEINCIRKHFSAVKGGRLALAAARMCCISLLVSDVPAGNSDAIASGPTLPDRSTVSECHEIVTRYHLLDQFPASVRQFFVSALKETVKTNKIGGNVVTILSAEDLANAAKTHAENLGFHTVVDNTCDDWDYRDAATYLLDRVLALKRNHRRVCLISVGEVIVQPGHGMSHIISGNGGRNQHFILYTALLLKNIQVPVAVLSAGSDGIDGNSDAAGAVIDEQTLGGAGDRQNGRNPYRDAELALKTFHSSTFLESVGARVITGPTGNNLRDLRILISEPRSENGEP